MNLEWGFLSASVRSSSRRTHVVHSLLHEPYMRTVNPELGYPKMTVASVVDIICDTHTFSSGKTNTDIVVPPL